MTIAMLMDFPGLDGRRYDELIDRLQLGGVAAPGCLFHVSGPCGDNWRIVDVWESPHAFDTYLQHTLQPIMEDLRIPTPYLQIFPVHHILQGAQMPREGQRSLRLLPRSSPHRVENS